MTLTANTLLSLLPLLATVTSHPGGYWWMGQDGAFGSQTNNNNIVDISLIDSYVDLTMGFLHDSFRVFLCLHLWPGIFVIRVSTANIDIVTSSRVEAGLW